MSMDDREKAFEAQFGHSQEMRFKAEMRRNRKIGAWAGALLNLEGAALDAYINDVMDADFEEVGDEDVMAKIMSDLNAKHLDISEHRLRIEMDRCMAEAKRELSEES